MEDTLSAILLNLEGLKAQLSTMEERMRCVELDVKKIDSTQSQKLMRVDMMEDQLRAMARPHFHPPRFAMAHDYTINGYRDMYPQPWL